MVNAKKLIESEYINVELIKNSDDKIGLIVSKPTEVKGDYGKNLEFMVSIDGEVKKFTSYRKSTINLIESYDQETDNWVQKKIRFEIQENTTKKEIVVAFGV